MNLLHRYYISRVCPKASMDFLGLYYNVDRMNERGNERCVDFKSGHHHSIFVG